MIPTQKCPHCGVEQPPQIRDGISYCPSCLRPLESISGEAPSKMPPIPHIPKATPAIPPVPKPIATQPPSIPNLPPVPPVQPPSPPPQPKPRSNPELNFDLEIHDAPLSREEPNNEEEPDREPSPRRAPRRTKRDIVRPDPALQQKALPFELEPNEQIFMQGGFGTRYAIIWLCLAIPLCLFPAGLLMIVTAIDAFLKGHYIWVPVWILMFVVLVVFCLHPLLRTGRYWLTTERLYWKPKFGKTRQMWIREIEQIVSGKMATSLKIYDVNGNKMTLRFVSDLPRVWGGINVLPSMNPKDLRAMQETTEDDLDTRPQVDVTCFKGNCVRGIRDQGGLVVLRPDYVAFLPMGKNMHVAYELVKLTAGKVVMDTLGKKEDFPVQAEMPFDLIVSKMAQKSPKKFDRFIENAVEEFQGTFFHWDEVEVSRVSYPLLSGGSSIHFEAEGVKLIGRPGASQNAEINAIVREWNGGKHVPMTYPILRFVILTLLTGAMTGWICYKASQSNGPVVDVGFVSAAQIMDRDQTPEAAFGTYTGTPNRSTLTILPKGKNDSVKHALVTCREESNLILYISERDEIYKHLTDQPSTPKTKKSQPPPKKTEPVLDRGFPINGQVFNGGSDGGLNNRIPRQAIRDYATNELGLVDVSKVRVMIVGKTPRDDQGVAYLAYAFASIPGVLALFSLFMLVRGVVFTIGGQKKR